MTRRDYNRAIRAHRPGPQPGAGGAANSGPPDGQTLGAAADSATAGSRSLWDENDLATATPKDLIPLYRALIDADDRGDAAALARLGWTLFSIASTAQQAQRETVALLSELRAAARAASVGGESRASLALLRHVLAKHGWLPPPDATPLQVLAAPPGGPDLLDPPAHL
jgi:hypothetical protein